LKLRILHKGLLLIFLPLLLQLVFFGQLFSLVSQMEKLEKEEELRMFFIQSSDEIIMEFGASWTAIVCKLFGSGGYKQDPEAYKARMQEHFARLKPYAKDYPRLYSLILETEQTAQVHYEIFKDLQNAANSKDGSGSLQLLDMIKLRPKLATIGTRTLLLKSMLETESAALHEARKKNEENRQKLKQQIYFGVIADSIITVLLLTAFLLDITKRLKLLVANAHLIPSGKRLGSRVSGNDELAMLDNVLHDASDELLSAKEHRKSLMEMVAHDLRSPLSTAKSTVDLLLTPAVSASEEKSHSHLERLRRSLIQLIAFVEDLLTIDKLESGKLELELSVFKIQSLVDDCFASVAIKVQARGIILVKEGQDCEVAADQARLTQVVMNLLTNAIKHSPDGGTISVVTERHDNSLMLSVIDQGKGISKADSEKIFQKFVQSKDGKQKEGYGLGLAICKLIIDAHKGRIGVNSAAGKGAEFWFTLPDDED